MSYDKGTARYLLKRVDTVKESQKKHQDRVDRRLDRLRRRLQRLEVAVEELNDLLSYIRVTLPKVKEGP